MKNNGFDVPILFIIFNRPDTTKQVFEQIKKRKPAQLFISADGPRPGRQDDIENCAQARAIVDHIDWPCQVHTLFRDKNLGCGPAPSQAISWFFEHVEQGIILEDDCVPDLTFFDFCRAMLERYKDDHAVMMVTGTSYLFNQIKSEQSYFFSRFYAMWGWATWRRAWLHFDFELKDWDRTKDTVWLRSFFGNQAIVDFWIRNFDRIAKEKNSIWDIQWAYACIKNQAFCIVPFNNLISNIGFMGTHTGAKMHEHDIVRKPIDVGKLIHPACVCPQLRLDKKIYTNIYVLQPLTIKNIIKKLFPYAVTIKRAIYRVGQKNDLQNL